MAVSGTGDKLSEIIEVFGVTGVSGTSVTIPFSSVPSSFSITVRKIVGLIEIISGCWVTVSIGVGGSSGIVSSCIVSSG